MMDLISIIVPVYNVSSYLEKCLDSIVNQSYSNLEIILVDDGATDNSGIICDTYSVKDKRIKVIHKENGGLSSARNAGIDIARGKYFAFIDSDDWIEFDFIELLYNSMKLDNADISQCSFIQERGEHLSDINRVEEVKLITGVDAIENLYNKHTYIDTVVSWNKLYNRKLFDEIRYPEGMINEDEAIIHEILYGVNKVAINESTLYHYTIRDNSITKSEYNIKKLDSITAFEKRLDFLKKNKEFRLMELTTPWYFRVLLDNATKLHYSQIKDKEIHISEITTKITNYLSFFKKNNNMSKIDEILLKCYLINTRLGFYVNNKILTVKNSKGND